MLPKNRTVKKATKMKVSEAKTKVCPFMSLNGIDRNGIAYIVKSKCICGDCMSWKYTRTDDTYMYSPKALCLCGKSYNEEHMCWDCGTMPTPERAYGMTKKLGGGKELPEDDKEGYCSRLKRV